MLKIKRDIDRQILKLFTYIMSNLNNFHSLEFFDRGSEKHFQMGTNSNEVT